MTEITLRPGSDHPERTTNGDPVPALIAWVDDLGFRWRRWYLAECMDDGRWRFAPAPMQPFRHVDDQSVIAWFIPPTVR